jgi:hypothetical protein
MGQAEGGRMSMDEKLLEFWGNFLINAARGKKQTDDFFRWMRSAGGKVEEPHSVRPLPGMEEFAATFRKFYGLDDISERGEEYKQLYEKSLRDFQRSFQEYLSLLGVVPREEHLALVEKYESLKERSAEQAETIRHLKMLLASRESDRNDLPDQFQDLVRNQSELFQRMLSEIGQCFTRPGDDAAGDENTPRGKGENESHETDHDGPEPVDPDV